MKKNFFILLLITFTYCFNANFGAYSQTNDPININFLTAVFDNDIRKVDSLIKIGADVNYIGYDKIPALHYAIYNNNIDIINLLISSLVNIEISDYNGKTALNLAATLGKDSLIYLFILKNAIIDTVDYFGMSPLHNAVYSGNEIAVDMLLFYGASTETLCKNDLTPLISAVEIGNYEMVYNLLSHRANPDFVTNNKNAAIFSAINYTDIDILELLKHYGADLTIKNNKNQNLLDIAIISGNIDLINTIMDISGLQISDINKQKQIWKEVLYEREKSKYKVLKEIGLKRPKSTIYGGFHLNQSFLFNRKDFYSITGFGIHELNYNFRLGLSFASRYSSRRTLIEYDTNTFYIVNSKRYFFNFEFDKFIQLYRLNSANKINMILHFNCPYIKDNYKDINFKTNFYLSYGFGVGVNYAYNNQKEEISIKYNMLNFRAINKNPHYISIAYSLKIFKL